MKHTKLIGNLDTIKTLIETKRGVCTLDNVVYKYKIFSKGYTLKTPRTGDYTIIFGEIFDYENQKRLLLAMKDFVFDILSEKLAEPYYATDLFDYDTDEKRTI